VITITTYLSNGDHSFGFGQKLTSFNKICAEVLQTTHRFFVYTSNSTHVYHCI